jgi:hypothetical protein
MSFRSFLEMSCLSIGLSLIVFGIIAFLVTTVLFMLGWSLFLVPVFGFPAITWIQAAGAIIVLWVVGGAFRAITK